MEITKQQTTVLKAVSIIMVVIEHIGQVNNIGFLNPLGPIGVFVFLFLSGYGLYKSFKKMEEANTFENE